MRDYCWRAARARRPHYEYTQGEPKALLDMHGRTLLERVVDAAQESKYIEDVIVVGLGSDRGMTFQRPVIHLPDHGSLVQNGIAGLNWISQNKPQATHFFGASGDVPLLSGTIIDDLIETCRPFEYGVYYNFVTRQAMEKRFPHSTRTYVKLKGLEVAGGDIAVMSTQLGQQQELLETLANARKHAWKIARIVGLRMLLKLLFRQVSLEDIETTSPSPRGNARQS
ncbi:MAG: NTP transferase domain-containing protein, partial [Anaerolineae bacterium]|nr:NTP transferase domain-containing protein [Anaerolineae bacterium]